MITNKLGGFGVHISLLAILIVVVIYGVLADSENAAFFINGIIIYVFDIWAWVILAPFSILIRKQKILFITLLIISICLVGFKIYVQLDGGPSLTGSILGELYGVLFLGYVINAAAIVTRKVFAKIDAK